VTGWSAVQLGQQRKRRDEGLAPAQALNHQMLAMIAEDDIGVGALHEC
jgi:hypothetical protein